MLLVLEDEHKEHLNFLVSVNVEVVQEFCRIAMEFIRKGINHKMYLVAAQKLKVDAETVQHGVEGLMYLLSESAKLMVTEIDFQDSILTLGFSEELKQELLRLYLDNRKEIRTIQSEMAMDLPHYHNLEWRLDIELASRSLHHQTNPSLLLKLHTEESGSKTTQLLETDPSNLLHMTQCLESALAEVKSQHCRRIMRNINK
ncbi:COMM domain-containing protein 2-like isoform X1 [Acanthaster planci]|uniref:COMM domain-containing protein 2-like isoform X1 n=2 Tax=Acanthaster planci TaxID=133434 RepID=A0A8B7Y6Z8_ACAPL|nr:COMM domain-containing protein 2-like isoform X1 [Acanthaster planci]